MSVAIDEKNNENDLVIRSKSGRAEKNMSSLWVEVSLESSSGVSIFVQHIFLEVIEIGVSNCFQESGSESGSRNTQSSSFASDVYQVPVKPIHWCDLVKDFLLLSSGSMDVCAQGCWLPLFKTQRAKTVFKLSNYHGVPFLKGIDVQEV